MTVKDIIKEYLINNGYDGLFSSDTECACTIKDLNACDERCDDCEPGYLQKTPCGRLSNICTKDERLVCRHENCWGTDYNYMIGLDKPE